MGHNSHHKHHKSSSGSSKHHHRDKDKGKEKENKKEDDQTEAPKPMMTSDRRKADFHYGIEWNIKRALGYKDAKEKGEEEKRKRHAQWAASDERRFLKLRGIQCQEDKSKGGGSNEPGEVTQGGEVPEGGDNSVEEVSGSEKKDADPVQQEDAVEESSGVLQYQVPDQVYSLRS